MYEYFIRLNSIKRCYYVVIGLFAFSLTIKAQTTKISSLHEKGRKLYDQKKYEESVMTLEAALKDYVSKNKVGLIYIEAMEDQAKSLIHSWESDKAISVYQSAYQLADSLGFDNKSIDLMDALISMYMFKSDFITAKTYTKRLLSRDSLPYRFESNANHTKARIFIAENNYDSAQIFFLKAIRIDSIHQDSSSMPFNKLDYGTFLYEHKKNYEEALTTILEGATYLREGIDDFKKVTFNDRLAEIYYRLGNINKTRQYATENLSLSEKFELTKAKYLAHVILGNTYRYVDEFHTALKHYLLADSINEQSSKKKWESVVIKSSIIDTKLDLGITPSPEEIEKIFSLEGETSDIRLTNHLKMLRLRLSYQDLDTFEFEKQFRLLSEQSNTEINLQNRKRLLSIKKEFYQRRGGYQMAFEIAQEINEINKEIRLKNNNYIVQDLNAKYEKEIQDNRITYLNKENEHKEEVVRRQKWTIGVGSFILLLISILTFFLWRLNKKVQDQKSKLAKALEEKDLLLREIHHRVKNNLQMVSSLLSLQGDTINDKTAQDAITEGKNRVRSMALIHQDLYHKENLRDIGVKEYIEKLTKELFDTYNLDRKDVQLSMSVQDIDLDIDVIVPLGLIINELITNSLKYAFITDKKGILHIVLEQHEKDLVLKVEDNGKGYDISDDSRLNFGSTLIRALTEQLNGDLSIDHENGTKVNIVFNKIMKAGFSP